MTSLLANTFIHSECKNCGWTFKTNGSKPEAKTALDVASSHVRDRGHYVDYSCTYSEVITP